MIVIVAVDVADMAQCAITDKPDAGQALLLHRAEESLDVRVAVGCAGWNANDRYPSITQDIIKACFAEFTTAIVNEVGDAVCRQESGIAHGQVAGQLLHDDLIRMHRDHGDV